MKVLLIAIIGFIQIFGSFAQNQINSKIRLYGMSIRYVENNLETPLRVDCTTFPYMFGNSIKRIDIIRDTTFLNNFFKKLNSISETNSEYRPDVRIQIELSITDGSHKMLCIGESNEVMVYDCKILKYNRDLIAPILKLIENQENKK